MSDPRIPLEDSFEVLAAVLLAIVLSVGCAGAITGDGLCWAFGDTESKACGVKGGKISPPGVKAVVAVACVAGEMVGRGDVGELGICQKTEAEPAPDETDEVDE